MELTEHTKGAIWIADYPVHYAGTRFNARMTVIRLADGRLILHSPGDIDAAGAAQIAALGTPAFIVAPGSYHYLHVASAKAAFPGAEVWICPGVERKAPDLQFDGFLSDTPPEAWAGELDQCLLRGNRIVWEVAFFHRASKVLILTDLIENIGDDTPGTDWTLKLWWKAVFHMWNHPKPAPEYQIGWSDKKAAKASLERILDWDFDRIILAHGDLIDEDAKSVARQAWQRPLSWSG
ncbi:DUF4336 domain-containing protein [Thalassovita mangrovi]|uniref:DUF4336 domain-containing protein n=1 Tax=Thalassovita mangrovi TaxID=2692236 RepID=A0A6L8LUV5_9RHOB|nr:DUF4336 domain-containing protein [Thalassovita mangrovi]MYM57122.1 DUF4336 domain-containing protein [Thalassovita mangrovi]